MALALFESKCKPIDTELFHDSFYDVLMQLKEDILVSLQLFKWESARCMTQFLLSVELHRSDARGIL